MSTRTLILATALVLLAAPLTGCITNLFGGDDPIEEQDVNAAAKKFVDNETTTEIARRLAPKPTNYTFDGQVELPPVVEHFNGTIGPEANAAYSDRNDRGGNSYNTPRVTTDISKFLPPGQPVEMRLTLAYAGTPGSSAKLDILVDVPGTQTAFNPSNNDAFNWKFSVQRMVVNTVGVSGVPALVGVEASNGQILGTPMPFSIRMEFHYAEDVLTPYHPWAFEVPANASGIILESEKLTGPEHLKSEFIIVGPDDELVQYVVFDDINIPTESVFIPTSAPGQYIFYAYYMEGGFLRLRADTPVDDRTVVPLNRVEDPVVDETGPAPGLAERNWGHGDPATEELPQGLGSPTTPAQGGTEKGFSVEGTFPLEIIPFIGADDGSGDTLMTEIKISSGKGMVAKMQRVLRHDDGSGSLGYTQDEWNTEFQPENLQKGSYTVTIVNNAPANPAGHVLVTYQR